MTPSISMNKTKWDLPMGFWILNPPEVSHNAPVSRFCPWASNLTDKSEISHGGSHVPSDFTDGNPAVSKLFHQV